MYNGEDKENISQKTLKDNKNIFFKTLPKFIFLYNVSFWLKYLRLKCVKCSVFCVIFENVVYDAVFDDLFIRNIFFDIPDFLILYFTI